MKKTYDRHQVRPYTTVNVMNNEYETIADQQHQDLTHSRTEKKSLTWWESNPRPGDDALHFKFARSVLKIASFEFANLKYFNSTFINLKNARLVLNAKCENSRVHISDCFVLNKI